MALKAIDLICGEEVIKNVNADFREGAPWLSGSDIARATGWQLKAEGLCRAADCVPVAPADRRRLYVDGRYDLIGLATLLNQPIAHDNDYAVWCIGEGADTRRRALTSLVAPDFALPDLDGQMRSLAEYRGVKVLLVSWASW